MQQPAQDSSRATTSLRWMTLLWLHRQHNPVTAKTQRAGVDARHVLHAAVQQTQASHCRSRVNSNNRGARSSTRDLLMSRHKASRTACSLQPVPDQSH